MANTHRYGFRFQKNRWGGDTPEIITMPVLSAQTFSTGVTVNLNIGDPVQVVETTGGISLVTAGNADTTNDAVERTLGIVAGFPRVLIGGGIRPNAFLPSGTVYGTGFAPSSLQTLVSIIPVAGAVFEVDVSAAGGGSFDTLEEWQTLVYQTLDFTYTPINTTTANPKANPLALLSSRSVTAAALRQLRILGVGALGDQIDYSAANVTLRVAFNQVQESPFVTAAGTDLS